MKLLKIHYMWSPPSAHYGLYNISIFGQKLPTWTVHHTFQEIRHPEVTRNLNYVLSTRRIQIPTFLDSSSWTPISPTPRKKSAFETWVLAHQVRRICLYREYASSNKIILLVLTIFHYMIIASQGLKCLWVFLKSAAI